MITVVEQATVCAIPISERVRIFYPLAVSFHLFFLLIAFYLCSGQGLQTNTIPRETQEILASSWGNSALVTLYVAVF